MAIIKHDRYPFLNDRLAREAHIDEVLGEIEAAQRNWNKQKTDELATIEMLNESRNIKLPITQKRLNNIQYLVDLLIKDHPAEIKPVYSFNFIINPENKNLTIIEKMELSYMMRESEYQHLQASRDEKSAENLVELLGSFRLFNLTKLIKKSKNRTRLSEVVKSRLGTTIFTFKNFSLDKNGLEVAEDYCFHRVNYDAVKSKIDLEPVKRVISANEPAIDRRLKNFGILNSTVSDFRDNKLEYILNILTGDLAPSLDKKDFVEVKNFKHLRECILKVDKLMDPVVMLDNEIMKHLNECFIATERDITSLYAEMNSEALTRWESEKEESGQILIHLYNNVKYLIDPVQFLTKYETYTRSIIYSDESAEVSDNQRDTRIFTADMLTDAGIKILLNQQNALKILTNREGINKLQHLIEEYQDYKKTLIALRNAGKNEQEEKGGASFLARLANSIIMLFTRKEKNYAVNPEKKGNVRVKKGKPTISTETRDIYKEISMRSSQLIPISDFIEIKPENESKIDTIIAEMRANNLKIIIPIYNARQTLYAQRSKKYLLSDVEYLMIDPEVAASPESIREYIDSITGFKLKEDTITGSALFSIEKYLMSIYRQNRAKLKRSMEKK